MFWKYLHLCLLISEAEKEAGTSEDDFLKAEKSIHRSGVRGRGGGAKERQEDVSENSNVTSQVGVKI